MCLYRPKSSGIILQQFNEQLKRRFEKEQNETEVEFPLNNNDNANQDAFGTTHRMITDNGFKKCAGGLLNKGLRLTKSAKCGMYDHQILKSLMNDALKPPNDKDNIQTMEDIKVKLLKKMGINEKYKNEDRSWLSKYLPKTQSELPPRSMNDSYDIAIVPLSTDLVLQNKYTTTLKSLRMGRLLEDMDNFAVWVVMKHIHNPKQPDDIPTPYVIVTLLVDDVIINPIQFSDRDLILSGQVTYAGKTSLEVTLWLDQKNGDKFKRITRAHFVFVARDPTNTKSVIVNNLVPTGEREKQILLQSAKKNEDRKKARQNAILEKIPTSEELSLMYGTILKTVDQNKPIIGNTVLPNNCMWMNDTKMETNNVCHPEDRNLHYTVFGGYLMRVACELAFLVASIHCKSTVELKAIHNITFREPVPLGSRLKLTGKICYTTDRTMIVQIIAEVEEITSTKSFMSNSFDYVFVASKDFKEVLPQDSHDSLLYIDGRRRYCEFVDRLKSEDH
ncbi:HotDog domain,Hotdog acyl-CoA thioesterase (ACOT)-type domain,Thioesterase domain [Cinara cedri]|uniref:HotDog domain,Hotdog acyl-CoA thioesterase (ACOT)-type domain,Thioesterase domain n=1 Tax=Cinara cedri TaxID=506608 RepID=A0A5E4NCM0_9HEMI|nr:HotDog domain,Hotdog acyl-CoA thioesterase (ACOT)-type domain,Thioesterase domain [Cinara cedri]